MMNNPLWKRIPRELRGEIGKYIAIFLFLAATIGFISGFLVADGSMLAAYDESFEKYDIENGNFELLAKANEELLEKLEGQEHIEGIYENFYVEEDTDNDGDGRADATMRIFMNREEVNRADLMDGRFPEAEDEIAIDRMYADNNELSVGDTVEVAGSRLEITGLVALSDYSALFSDNSDMMFDAMKFGVAVMTKDGFAQFGDARLHYGYAWKYDEEPEDDAQEKAWSEELAKEIYKLVFDNTGNAAAVVKFIPRYANQAIRFTGNDMGGDRSMMLVLLYILLAILAFVFAVTTNHTITNEAAVIGTLRASGYTKRELLCHYISLPVLITVLGALVGNILGYTAFKELCAGMYYGSYSLPAYETRWNVDAFLLTTVIPVILMLVINLVIIYRKLGLSPLQFLRRDLTRRRRKKAIRLPHFSFFTRFRLRIILQNMPSYVTLLIGITFANILLLFGMMMSPLLAHFQQETISHMAANYQYVLKVPVQTAHAGAESYCACTLVTREEDGSKSEDITIYGVERDSRFVDVKLPEDGVYVSDSYADKYGLSKGDKITLKEKYSDEEHQFDIAGVYEYPAALAVFMAKEAYAEEFGMEEGYFNGYFSDEKLEDMPQDAILSVITEDDLTKVSRQLDVSMGKMFYMINVFAVVLYALLIYLLTKLIIERNASSISMVKILGYRNGEISRLYLLATTWVVIVSVMVSLLLATGILNVIYRAMLSSMTGWLTFYMAPWIYPAAFVMGLAAYGLVALLQMRGIWRIPMDEALKHAE